ncbi:Ribonuclease h domain [Thalictrum thalictroides]|uniref:Ribonuclease h domain n=1 Tax=Thalictrum thalictroides TaxID=46969 RepID=A0A7J6VU74_THATH|nr:Ribonuclease h domain [Thalictrum thalictroides]
MFSNFLWGSAQGKLKKHWISWERIAKPKEEGGLGIRPLKTVLKAFRMKATWNLLNSDNLWAVFMRAKYIQNRSIRGIRLCITASKAWKDIWHCLEEVIEESTWEFGPGNFSITHENWTGLGSLAHRFTEVGPQFSLNHDVANNLFLPIFTTQQQEYLRSQYQLLVINQNEDKRRWPHSSNGEFSIKSYIKLTHGSNNSNSILKRIWMTWIPTKLSFFGWKLFFEAIPVDMAVIGCQIPIVSKCLCC